MQYFDVILAFIAFAGLCLFFWKKTRLPGGLTPLASCSVIILVLTLAGIAGVLRLGGWLLYIIGIALAVWVPVSGISLFRKKQTASRGSAYALADFAFVSFWVLCIVTALVFALRKPVFAEWDELSFWGTASKLLKLNDALYTTATVGWDWVGAQQPGAVLTGYFFQFFGTFAPWKTFVGYDVLLFSAYAAVVSGVNDPRQDKKSSWKQYPLSAACLLLCLLSPYLLAEYCRILDVTNTYMSAYGDLPAGILAAGAAAWYFALRRSSGTLNGESDGFSHSVGHLAVYLIFAAVGLIKENAFPVVMVAAGICAFDRLCFRVTENPPLPHTKLWRRIVSAIGVLAAPLVAYLTWSRHVASVVALRESTGQVGTTNLTVTQVVVLGIRQLLFPAQRTSLYIQVSKDMLDAFVHTRLTLLGSLSRSVLDRLLGEDNPLSMLTGTGLCVAAVCTGLFLVAALLAPQKMIRRRTLTAGLFSLLGFVGYYWVLILSYAFIFKPTQAAILSDYNRYVVSYYIFWFLLSVAHLTLGAGCRCETSKNAIAALPAEAQDPRRRTALMTLFAVGVAGLSLLVTAIYIRPQMTVLDYPETTFTQQIAYENTAQTVAAQIDDCGLEGTIFFVSTDDNGGKYFNYCYQLLPLPMDYSFGGGPIGSADNYDGSPYYHTLSLSELTDYLIERDCAYIFTEHVDAVFEAEYASLFTDCLAGARQGTVQLYYRVNSGDSLLYAPVQEVALP